MGMCGHAERSRASNSSRLKRYDMLWTGPFWYSISPSERSMMFGRIREAPISMAWRTQTRNSWRTLPAGGMG